MSFSKNDFEASIRINTRLSHKLFFFDMTDSTNERALECIASKEAEGGEVFIARKQTAGKGTRGRSFYSEDGLYMSVILKNDGKIKNRTLFAAVCVCKALEELYGTECKIKWVNDILLSGKKLCGILCSSRIEIGKEEPEFIVIGIGINTNTISFPCTLSGIATSLAFHLGMEVDDSILAGKIISFLEGENFSLEDYRRRMLILGKMVTVSLPCGENLCGEASGIAEDGSLLILSDGETKKIISGDVTLLNQED